MKLTRPLPCPHCGGITSIKDYRSRKTKIFTGQTVWYKVPRIRCEKCGKVTTILPDFIPPFKQYTA